MLPVNNQPSTHSYWRGVETILANLGYYELHQSVPPLDHKLYEHNVSMIRNHLDDTTFAVAWAEGQAMTLDEAVAYALIINP